MATTLPQLDTDMDDSFVPSVLTLEEYLQTIYHPDAEFVDDHIEERHLGEYEHSTLQVEIGIWFGNRRREWNIRVATEYRTRTGETRIRIPDVSVFRNDGLRERVRTTPPLICIEVLSPEDRISRVKPRLQEFVDMGVTNIWVLDPEKREAFIFIGGQLLRVEESRIQVPNSPIFLDLSEVFSALD